jgi:hypothetical protein
MRRVRICLCIATPSHVNNDLLGNFPANLHLVIHTLVEDAKGRRKPAPSQFRNYKGHRLLRGDLPRRIERARIVDFSDLMVGEAENLPKNFVGVFAEQRRARHL